MMGVMSADEIRRTAEFYGIDMVEAQRRYEVVQAQADNPEDPICIGCARRPSEMFVYDSYVDEHIFRNQVEETSKARTRACIREEGTLNPVNGHFLCDDCYIRNGQPSSDRGWVCP